MASAEVMARTCNKGNKNYKTLAVLEHDKRYVNEHDVAKNGDSEDKRYLSHSHTKICSKAVASQAEAKAVYLGFGPA